MKLGMGLMMNTDFSFGKAASLDGLSRTSNSLRPHSSRSEANYLQGVAATANLSRHLSLTAFFSHRLIDATLNKDSATVKTILKTGYHRTASEMARRRNTSQTVGGASMAVRSGGFTAALSAMGTTFNRQLRPDTSAVFRRFYPKGQKFGNASLSYSYLSPRLQVAGEAPWHRREAWQRSTPWPLRRRLLCRSVLFIATIRIATTRSSPLPSAMEAT